MPPNAQYKREPIKMATTGMVTAMPGDLLPAGKFPMLRNVRQYLAGTIEARHGVFHWNDGALPVTGSIGVHSIRRMNDNIGVLSDGVPDFVHVVGSGAYISVEIDTAAHAFITMTPLGEGASNVFSTRPLSLTPWRPERSPRTFMYIWDTLRCMKVGRNDITGFPAYYVMENTGIFPPTSAPTATNTGGGVGPAGAGLCYYRYRYRSRLTGAKSNPSPVPAATVSGTVHGGVVTPTGNTITISCIPSSDAQVEWIDIFRFGNALLDYRYVGSIVNTGVVELTFNDTKTDAQLQAEEILGEDNDQPFTVAGLPLGGGTCNTTINSPFTGVTTVTNLPGSLSNFRVANVDKTLSIDAGSIITINGSPYAVYAPTTSDTTLLIVGTTKNATGTPTSLAGATWSIDQPTLLSKPMPFVWGPFENSFLGCGDFYNPGTLYWTNGNDPDSASSANFQEVTPPTEPLMNGFTLNERAYVFSSNRLFVIYPAFLATQQWTILETPCQRGLAFNWAFATTNHKDGGDWCYFRARDGIYRTQGGMAECISGDIYNLFHHEGSNQESYNLGGPLHPYGETLYGSGANRFYERLSIVDEFLYWDFLDSQSPTPQYQTLVYDTKCGGWFWDSYNQALKIRMHSNEEGREVGATTPLNLLMGGDDGRCYVYAAGLDENVGFGCRVHTSSWDAGDPGAQKLFGDVTIDIDCGDQALTVQPLYDNNQQTLAAAVFNTPSRERSQRIVDILSGIGQTAYNLALDFSWTNVGLPTRLFMWMPSGAPKPEDSQQRCVEWHEFITGGDDAYVMGIRIWCDTRDMAGVVQTKSVQVWADEANTGNTLSITSLGGEQKLEFSWPYFKAKLGRLLPTDTNRWRVLKWEWIADPEPFLISAWDTNWKSAGDGLRTAYVTGIVIEADTLGAAKTLIFESEFEMVVTTHIPLDGVSTMTALARMTKHFAFTPFRAIQLRMHSYDGNVGRLYNYQWIIHLVEPEFLSNWDSLYEWFSEERLIKGVRIDADTLAVAKSINVELDGVVYTTLTVTHDGRRAIHYDMPLDPNTNEYPRARMARLYPTDTSPAFLYKIGWIADQEPPRLANWNSKWEDGGYFGAHYLQGFVLDADTGGTDKQVVVEYYPEDQASAITIAQTFDVNHSGRGGKAYSLDIPVVAHKFRLRPLDTNQNWLYGVKWVFEPHPEKVKHWETQAYAHGLPGYQHRRDAYIAYESNTEVYWTQVIDGQAYTIQLPNTNGEYRKVHVPCLPIKGKLFKDIFDTDPPADGVITYVASLTAVEETFTEGVVGVVTGDGALNASDPSVEVS